MMRSSLLKTWRLTSYDLEVAGLRTASSSKFEEPVWQTVLFAGYFFGQHGPRQNTSREPWGTRNGMAYLMKRVLSQAQVWISTLWHR